MPGGPSPNPTPFSLRQSGATVWTAPLCLAGLLWPGRLESHPGWRVRKPWCWVLLPAPREWPFSWPCFVSHAGSVSPRRDQFPHSFLPLWTQRPLCLVLLLTAVTFTRRFVSTSPEGQAHSAASSTLHLAGSAGRAWPPAPCRGDLPGPGRGSLAPVTGPSPGAGPARRAPASGHCWHRTRLGLSCSASWMADRKSLRGTSGGEATPLKHPGHLCVLGWDCV